MIIIIDAYNYIKSISAQRFTDEQSIVSWITTFQNYTRIRGNRVILVFDAGPSYFQTKESYGNVQVVYAGHQRTADDVIKDWIQENAGFDVLLVTSDRQIRDHGQRFQITSINSFDFHKVFNSVMQQEERSEQALQKTVYKMKNDELSDNNELDRLMEEGSRHLVAGLVKSEHHESMVRIRDGKKASKVDKSVMKKINKI